MTDAQERAAIVRYLDAMAVKVEARAGASFSGGSMADSMLDVGGYTALRAVARAIEQGKHLPGRAVPGASGKG